MDDFNEKLISILHYPEVTWKMVFHILKKDPDLHSFNHHNPIPIQQNLFFEDSNKLSHSKQLPVNIPQSEIIHEQIQQYEKNEIKIITIFDKEYPVLLKEIYQPPWVLFAKGDLSLLAKETKLAVVGSRQATQYGKNAIRLILPRLIKHEVLTVSGLAKGIDSLVHEYTMKNGGNTIAVIAGGLYHIYPKENMDLALEMMKTQLVISEYPPDTKPLRWHFLLETELSVDFQKEHLL